MPMLGKLQLEKASPQKGLGLATSSTTLPASLPGSTLTLDLCDQRTK